MDSNSSLARILNERARYSLVEDQAEVNLWQAEQAKRAAWCAIWSTLGYRQIKSVGMKQTLSQFRQAVSNYRQVWLWYDRRRLELELAGCDYRSADDELKQVYGRRD